MIPNLRNLTNEVVFTLTLVATILGEIVAVLNDIDWESGLLALFPLISGLIARTKVYGPDVANLLADMGEELIE